jgi:hypothetical protein
MDEGDARCENMTGTNAKRHSHDGIVPPPRKIDCKRFGFFSCESGTDDEVAMTIGE